MQLAHKEISMNIQRRYNLARTLLTGILAGLTGGTAEIAWIALYGALMRKSAPAVARGVTEAIAPAWATSSHGVSLGILIHLLLAMALGTCLVLALRLIASRGNRAPSEFPWMIAALATVWAINFFLLLPRISPGFVELLPYATTMVSKLLFGLAAAAVFRAKRADWLACLHVE
jgi:hypothetical protein